jgi:hypothetical protein
MTRGGRRARLAAALVAALVLARAPAAAQLVLGQYEDEAPLGTWNILGSASAAAAGLGVAFARPFDASVSLAAPALLTALPRLSVSLSGSYALSQLRKFSLVNTGVVASSLNLAAGVIGLDHGAFAFRSGRWAFAAAVAAPESFARPAIVAGNGAIGATYELRFAQTGYLRTFHAAAARRWGSRLAVGLGVNLAVGRLDRSVVERTETPVRVVTITDEKSESLRGLFFNGGIAWDVSPRLTASLVFRSPYVRKGRGTSLLRYEVPEAGTDIRTEAEATNTYRQPWVLGGGGCWRPGRNWLLAAEAAWFGWSAYEVTYFDEPLARAFRNIVRAGAGAEYLARTGSFGHPAGIAFRLGLTIDPQPTEPRSTYVALTLGTGLRYPAWSVDVSGSLGREYGSGDRLKAGRIVVSVRYVIGEGRTRE